MSDVPFEITAGELKRKLDAGNPVHVLDVREPDEIALCPFPGAEEIPMMPLFVGVRRTGAGQDDEIVVLCHTGARSLEAALFLRRQGFSRARSLRGGIDAWAGTVDPTMPRY